MRLSLNPYIVSIGLTFGVSTYSVAQQTEPAQQSQFSLFSNEMLQTTLLTNLQYLRTQDQNGKPHYEEGNAFLIDRTASGECVPVTARADSQDALKKTYQYPDILHWGQTTPVKSVTIQEVYEHNLRDYKAIKAYCNAQPECLSL